MDSSRSLSAADARKRALWDELHQPPAIRRWRLLSPAERDAVHAAWDDLLDAAIEARRTGWHRWERDPAVAAARALGVTLWPAAADRLAREARDLVG